MSIIEFGMESHIGLVRGENQDTAGKFPPDVLDDALEPGLLFVVADGMGGHKGGKEASGIAVDTVTREYFSNTVGNIADRLKSAFGVANAAIMDYGAAHIECRGMGSTLTAVILQSGKASIAHVGDSRAYKISDGAIIQLTEDHSVVAEWQRKGWLTEEQAKVHPERSLLYRALGVRDEVEVDLIEKVALKESDCLVLCTDGLSNLVENDEIRGLVLAAPPRHACEKMVALALERGGYDNITVQAIRVHNLSGSPEPKT